jgi:hypothetical protein
MFYWVWSAAYGSEDSGNVLDKICVELGQKYRHFQVEYALQMSTFRVQIFLTIVISIVFCFNITYRQTVWFNGNLCGFRVT